MAASSFVLSLEERGSLRVMNYEWSTDSFAAHTQADTVTGRNRSVTRDDDVAGDVSRLTVLVVVALRRRTPNLRAIRRQMNGD